MRVSSIFLPLLFVISHHAFANPGHHEPAPMPKQFEQLKKLVGTWEGTSVMEGKEEDVKVVYELTSGGTALVEKLMPGKPNEMVSIYHRDGKTVGMTHYCALGNQPHMTLKKNDDKTMAFEMRGHNGIASISEPHMHAVTLTLANADTLDQVWTHYMGGKKAGEAVFHFKRK